MLSGRSPLAGPYPFGHEGVAEVVEIPDCGHIVMVESPDESVRLVVDFVKRVAAGSGVQA